MKNFIERQKKEWKEAMIELNDYAGAFFVILAVFLVSCILMQALFIGKPVPIWGYEFRLWMYVSNVIQAVVGYIGIVILWLRDNRRLKEREKEKK